MPRTVTCSDAGCGVAIPVDGKEVGESVACPKCGTATQVLADFGDEFDIEGFETAAPAEAGAANANGTGNGDRDHIAHPARQQCPNCGAVLGVRDAICPKCNCDIRTGAAVHVVEEEKTFPLVPVLIGAGVALVIVIVVVVMVLAKK